MTATGSFMPDSPSSVCASRRRSVELRSSAKIAAPSVEARIEPSSSPSSSEKSNSHAAARPATSAVSAVPTVARLIAGAEHRPDLGEAGVQAALEQDQRERDDADRPRQLVVVERAIVQPKPSDPTSIPRPRNSSSDGTRTRPATSDASRPPASSAPR